MVTLTQAAADQVIKAKEDSSDTSKYLRIAVLEGGCSGNEYRLGFENEEYDGDSKFDSNGVTLIVDEKSLALVSGIEIDYQNGLQGSYFVFNNPQATGGCGCGKSFSA